MEKTFRKPGALVISLDFELFWGMFDKVSPEAYDDNIRGAHTVIPKLLELFQEKNIHATWAVVGLVITREHNAMPSTQPTYPNQQRSAYYFMNDRQSLVHNSPELFFAPELVDRIISTPGQELGSHTFAHYYTHESTNLAESFKADCEAMQQLLAERDVEARSLVFPRNQVTGEALTIAAQIGVKNYRGVESSLFYQNGSEAPLHLRLIRLLDAYVNITGHHTYNIKRSTTPINVPSSRFLRPYSSFLAPFESLRRKRITDAMTDAAASGRVFHLWWHPHNFGVNQEKNLTFLRKVLEHYQKLQKEYQMESLTMDEAGARRASELTF